MLWMMMSFSIGDHHPPCKWSLPLSYKKKKRGDFIVQSLFFIENHQFTFAGRLATRRKKGQKKRWKGKEDRKLSSAIHGHVFSPVEYIDISFSLSKWLKEEKHGIKLYLQLILVYSAISPSTSILHPLYGNFLSFLFRDNTRWTRRDSWRINEEANHVSHTLKKKKERHRRDYMRCGSWQREWHPDRLGVSSNFWKSQRVKSRPCVCLSKQNEKYQFLDL